MEFESEAARNFLMELHSMSQGETGVQVSMYDVGQSIGLDRGVSSAVAEDMIMQGLIELVSLSGGIAITPDGVKALGLGPSTDPGVSFRLPDTAILAVEDTEKLQEIVVNLKTHDFSKLSYDDLEELVLDVKTLDIQLLSRKPKVGVIREILSGLSELLAGAGKSELSALLKSIAGR